MSHSVRHYLARKERSKRKAKENRIRRKSLARTPAKRA